MKTTRAVAGPLLVRVALLVGAAAVGCASGSPPTSSGDRAAATRPAFATVHIEGVVGSGGYDLLVSTTEVTQREWRERMGTDPSLQSDCDDCPVERVSWYDAAAYANARSEAEGLPACYELDACTTNEWPRSAPGPRSNDTMQRAGLECQSVRRVGTACAGYRLPTLAEWDTYGPVPAVAEGRRAARAYAVFRKGGFAWPQAVGGRLPNERGLYDTVGNVEEWLDTSSLGPAEPRPWQRDVALQVWFLSTGGCFHRRVSALHPRQVYSVLSSYARTCLGFRLVRTLVAGPSEPAAPSA